MELSAELTHFERTPRDDAPPKKAKMTEQEPTKDDFQELGAEIMNRSPESSTSDFESNKSFARRWVSHFELVPYVVTKVWGMLAIEAEEKDARAKPVHLLGPFSCLKCTTPKLSLPAYVKCTRTRFANGHGCSSKRCLISSMKWYVSILLSFLLLLYRNQLNCCSVCTRLSSRTERTSTTTAATVF